MDPILYRLHPGTGPLPSVACQVGFYLKLRINMSAPRTTQAPGFHPFPKPFRFDTLHQDIRSCIIGCGLLPYEAPILIAKKRILFFFLSIHGTNLSSTRCWPTAQGLGCMCMFISVCGFAPANPKCKTLTPLNPKP